MTADLLASTSLGAPQRGDAQVDRVLGTRKRLRIWELDTPVHCAVIGTCLSVADLRRFARKLSLETVAAGPDYEIHGYFVGQMRASNALSRLVDGHLAGSSEGAFRRLERAETADAQRALWLEWVTCGRIGPGFWAFMAWSEVDPAVRRHVYGELHMLSHLHGHGAHVLRKTVADLERRLADLEERAGRDRATHQAALAERDRRIAEFGAGLLRARAQEKMHQTPALVARPRDEGRAARRIGALRATLARREEDIRQLDAEIARLRRGAVAGPAEAGAPTPESEHVAVATRRDGPIFVQDIRRVAYIGGRTGNIPRLEAIASAREIAFHHHDGGVEDNFHVIERLVTQADCLMCPIDCVSHSACRLAKELCRKHGKPFVPLRNASATCFARAIGAEKA